MSLRVPVAVTAAFKGSLVSFFLLHNPLHNLFPPLAVILLFAGPSIAGAMLYDRVRLPLWGNLLASLWIGFLNTLPYTVVIPLLMLNRYLFQDAATADWVIAVTTWACLGYTLFGFVFSLLGTYVRHWTKGEIEKRSPAQPVVLDEVPLLYKPVPQR
ncbi:MAG: hypothetical protein U0556_14510 [Dehalococcoidia bacterium]